MRLTLCVDALDPQPGGIGRYTWELCQGISASDDIQSLHFYGRGRLIDDPRVLIENRPLPRRRRFLRKLHEWRTDRVLRSSLVHGPNYFLPAVVDHGIITVHDLSVFRFPETHPVERVRAFERLFESSLRRAAHIITDTETVRQELIESLSLSSDMVTAVPLAVSARFRPESADPAFLNALGLEPRRYGLCVSTLEPRKKILELLNAWRRLPVSLRTEFPLVLAGGSGWENETLHAAIKEAGEGGWLRHLGFVEEGMLPALYAGAALFVYPSTYEGFGLPPLEAMASGVPVIVADQSCLPEVCGAAARYLDPENDDDFVETVRDSLEDGQWRTRAREMGLAQARRFTWSRCVDETLSVYRNVINLV